MAKTAAICHATEGLQKFICHLAICKLQVTHTRRRICGHTYVRFRDTSLSFTYKGPAKSVPMYTNSKLAIFAVEFPSPNRNELRKVIKI